MNGAGARRLAWLAAVAIAGSADASTPVVLAAVTDQNPSFGSVYRAVALAPATGEVLVGGFQVDRTVPDQTWILLRKFSAFGTLAWTVSFTGAAGLTNALEQSVRSIAIIPGSGTSYGVAVAGELFSTSGTGGDAWVARYDENGALQWSLTMDGATPGGEAGANGIALAPGNELVVTGLLHNAPGYGQLWVSRYDTAGNLQVGPQVLTYGVADAEGRAVAVDGSGSVYVAGFVTTPGRGRDAYVANLGVGLNTAAPVWQLAYDGAASGTDVANGIALLPGGDPVVAGATEDPGVKRDLWVARIANAGAGMGTTLWTVIRDGSGDDDLGHGVTADALGHVVVVGELNGPSLNWSDVWAAGYDANGAEQWEFDQHGTGHYTDVGWGVTEDAAGHVYLAAELWEGVKGRCATWFKLLPGSPGAAAVPTGAPSPTAAPNPFRPGSGGAQDAAGITFAHLPPNATVRVFSLDGHLVAELNDSANAGFIVWNAQSQHGKTLASGVYVYTVTAPTAATFRGKVVIVR